MAQCKYDEELAKLRPDITKRCGCGAPILSDDKDQCWACDMLTRAEAGTWHCPGCGVLRPQFIEGMDVWYPYCDECRQKSDFNCGHWGCDKAAN